MPDSARLSPDPKAPSAPLSTASPGILDLRGEVCPYTFVRSKLALEELADGAELEIWLDSAPAFRNVPRALREDGHRVLSCDITDDPPLCRIRVRCGASG